MLYCYILSNEYAVYVTIAIMIKHQRSDMVLAENKFCTTWFRYGEELQKKILWILKEKIIIKANSI